MGATYFLVRGLRKVTGEVAFFGVGHNIERTPPSPPKIRLSENSFLKFSDHITSLLFILPVTIFCDSICLIFSFRTVSPFLGIWKNDGVNVGDRSLFSFKICVYYACLLYTSFLIWMEMWSVRMGTKTDG